MVHALPRRVAALAAAAALLAGCTTHGRPHAVPPAPTTSAAAPTTRPPAAATAPSSPEQPRRRNRLTLLPPGCTPGQLRLAPATGDGGGGELYQVWSVRLVSGPPCTLWGTPTVRLLDSTGAVLPFSVTHRWLGRERRGPVLVDAHHLPAFPLAKYRCDTVPNPKFAAAVVATLPLGAGTVTGTVPKAAARLAFCPTDDGNQRVHVGTIGSWQTTPGPPPPHRVAISVHSSFAASGLATWGRADLDGDGRPDLVVVRPSGLVTATIGRQVVRIEVPGRPTDRLQGFTDLTGDGRPEILVGSTALGCAAGYRFCASRATAITLRERQLRVVRFPDPALTWDDGQGDLYAGVVCGVHGPTQVQVLMTGRHSFGLVRTAYRVAGLRARVVARTAAHGTGSPSRLAALAATGCPGLDPAGWAHERGPLG